jgi:hypothetical protein
MSEVISELHIRKTRKLLLNVLRRLNLVLNRIFFLDQGGLNYLTIKQAAQDLKSKNLDIDEIYYRLVIAETKLKVYESSIKKLSRWMTEFTSLELIPSKAGRKRNELAFVVAWDICDNYYIENNKFPTANALSERASKRLAKILNKDFVDENDVRLLPTSTARDYLVQFKKMSGEK